MPPKKPLTEYEKQRDIWYKKLKKEGFDDIESNEDNLKSWSSRFATKRSVELQQDREAYYTMATTFLNSYAFESPLEKAIWEYHVEAISIKDIAKLLRKAKVRKIAGKYKVDHNSVWSVVSKLEKAMKRIYLSGYEARD